MKNYLEKFFSISILFLMSSIWIGDGVHASNIMKKFGQGRSDAGGIDKVANIFLLMGKTAYEQAAKLTGTTARPVNNDIVDGSCDGVKMTDHRMSQLSGVKPIKYFYPNGAMCLEGGVAEGIMHNMTAKFVANNAYMNGVLMAGSASLSEFVDLAIEMRQNVRLYDYQFIDWFQSSEEYAIANSNVSKESLTEMGLATWLRNKTLECLRRDGRGKKLYQFMQSLACEGTYELMREKAGIGENEMEHDFFGFLSRIAREFSHQKPFLDATNLTSDIRINQSYLDLYYEIRRRYVNLALIQEIVFSYKSEDIDDGLKNLLPVYTICGNFHEIEHLESLHNKKSVNDGKTGEVLKIDEKYTNFIAAFGKFVQLYEKMFTDNEVLNKNAEEMYTTVKPEAQGIKDDTAKEVAKMLNHSGWSLLPFVDQDGELYKAVDALPDEVTDTANKKIAVKKYKDGCKDMLEAIMTSMSQIINASEGTSFLSDLKHFLKAKTYEDAEQCMTSSFVNTLVQLLYVAQEPVGEKVNIAETEYTHRLSYKALQSMSDQIGEVSIPEFGKARLVPIKEMVLGEYSLRLFGLTTTADFQLHLASQGNFSELITSMTTDNKKASVFFNLMVSGDKKKNTNMLKNIVPAMTLVGSEEKNKGMLVHGAPIFIAQDIVYMVNRRKIPPVYNFVMYTPMYDNLVTQPSVADTSKPINNKAPSAVGTFGTRLRAGNASKFYNLKKIDVDTVDIGGVCEYVSNEEFAGFLISSFNIQDENHMVLKGDIADPNIEVNYSEYGFDNIAVGTNVGTGENKESEIMNRFAEMVIATTLAQDGTQCSEDDIEKSVKDIPYISKRYDANTLKQEMTTGYNFMASTFAMCYLEQSGRVKGDSNIFIGGKSVDNKDDEFKEERYYIEPILLYTAPCFQISNTGLKSGAKATFSLVTNMDILSHRLEKANIGVTVPIRIKLPR